MLKLHGFLVLFIFVVINADEPPQTTNDSIVFTTILFRHGARTPMRIFATDPNRDTPLWKIGTEQLTNQGKNQALELGEFLRHRYSNLLNETYHKDNITVRSTDVDRTLQSAQCVLAGLYPPKDTDIWNSRITTWQPIPIHSRRKEDDPIRGSQPCPKYKAEQTKLSLSYEFISYANQYRALGKFITDKTNYSIKTLTDWEYPNDLYKIERESGLEWPEWLTEDMYGKIAGWALLSLRSQTYNLEMSRLKMGVFLGELIDHVRDKIDGKLSQNVWLYSAHDTTIINLLQTLEIFDPQFPPYSSAVLIDLHHGLEGYGISISFRNSTEVEPVRLRLPGCVDVCSVSKFMELVKDKVLTEEELSKECLNV